jgi:hypothetical protein
MIGISQRQAIFPVWFLIPIRFTPHFRVRSCADCVFDPPSESTPSDHHLTQFERSGENTVYDESIPFITKSPVPKSTPAERIALALHLTMRSELPPTASTPLRLPRGADRLRLIGVYERVRSDEPCVLARAGDLLTVSAGPDEIIGGVSFKVR